MFETYLRLIRSLPEKISYKYGLRSKEDLVLPDFLGIGAQKSGTSWLYENLKKHPDIYMPDVKELHYFDWEFYKSLKSYAANFTSGLNKVKGEITPGYSIISEKRIKFIKDTMPKVKLIFLMRNPIERAWSQALMNLVSLPRRRYDEVAAHEFYDHFKSERSLLRGDYFAVLKNWLNAFDEDQLYIGFYDDIIDNPKNLLFEIFDFLGVTRNVDWFSFSIDKIINKGPQIKLPSKYRYVLEDMYCKDIERLYSRYGGPIQKWLCENHKKDRE